MEGPAITVTEPPENEGPADDENGRTPETKTGSSSPTLNIQDAPRRKEIADTIHEEDSEYMHGERISSDWPENARLTRLTASSFDFAQIPIAEHMTVPPAEALNGLSRSV